MSEESTTDDRRPNFDKGGDKSGARKKFDKPFFKFKKRVDYFNINPDVKIDYKNVDVLVKFVSNKGKILPRRLTGLTPLHQRKVATAIKQARNAGLLPFSVK